MNSADHLFFALLFGGFAVIAGLSALALGAIGAPLPTILAAVVCSLCCSRFMREWATAKDLKRFERP